MMPLEMQLQTDLVPPTPTPTLPSGTVMIRAVGKPLIWKHEVKSVAQSWDCGEASAGPAPLAS